jgi:RNA polymerase sigma-70 factor (ECF subfamily)
VNAPAVTDAIEVVAELARARRAGLAALARREGLSPEDAFDCVQEALCTFLRAAQSGTLPEQSEVWPAVLATTVRNAARNKRRRHYRARPHAALDAELGASIEEASDELLARAEEHVRLRACVQELCEIQKAVVTLRMLEEQPGEDVARALGLSSGHVAVLLHRAKSALRVCMTDDKKAPGSARRGL